MYKVMDKVALIGFMGSGKSSVAPLLAATLSYRHVDVDKEIISRSKLPSIPDIFTAHGETFFRDLEAAVSESLADARQVVISTGGGIIGRPSNISHLKQNGGTIVFLRTQFNTVTARISDFASRPLFRDIDRARALYAERQPLYTRYADLIIDTDEKSPQQVCDEVIKVLGAVS
jgi:shikimate kinase